MHIFLRDNLFLRAKIKIEARDDDREGDYNADTINKNSKSTLTMSDEALSYFSCLFSRPKLCPMNILNVDDTGKATLCG